MACDNIHDFDLVGVRKRLWVSLQQLYLNDRCLIEQSISECSITHRLAVYLEQSFPVWHVDCEFNRSGDDPKLANEFRRSKRPDVIVHRRGKDGPNLLALEVKKSDRIDDKDRKKASGYVHRLYYRWAVCLSLQNDSAICEWQGEGIATPLLANIIWANVKEFGNGG